MIRWDTCKEDFRQDDGSLRDIYITQATLADWLAVYSLLCAYPGVEFSVDGLAQPPPASVEHVFAIRRIANPVLSFKLGAAVIHCHFFTDDEVECDFFPEAIGSQEDLDVLLALVGQLGNATQKRVVVTPENSREIPFISYDPGSREFEHHEIGG